ncbi:MAG: serine/threonine protein kinase [Acidobacteriota bacterium]|nr:serine/threonine protein kinase [Acidobacteriota bacterium]
MTSAVPLTGLIAGRYRIERLLGHGGMSDVYLATDGTGGPSVAVKVVRSTDPELADRLIREARAVAGFDHPNLVRLLQADIQDEHAYLVMELVDGPTLAVRLRQGPLPPERGAVLGAALADALDYVHRRGVVHRDVKPANVLLGPGPRVRLADFGIAQVIDASSATVTGTTLGTAAYMAPEQLAHHRVTTSADIWALAAVLLECLTGNRPFEGPVTEVVARRLAGAVPSPDGLPTAWRMLLTSMLEPDPRRRPEASEVAEMLRAPAFSRPWDPRPTEMFAAAGTALLAGAAGGDGGEAATAVGPATLAGAGPVPAAARRAPTSERPRALLGAAVLAAVVVVAAVVGWALAGSAPKAAASHRRTATTTTAPQATVASASEALVRDVQQGEASGALAPQVGQTVLSELGQALSAQAQNDPASAGNDLGVIDQAVTTADAQGNATVGEANTLIGDVAALAAAMGLQNPATTTTTADPPTTPPPQPPKHHH